MKRFELNHYGTGSTVTMYEDLQHLASITYTRKIHRYESESDFKAINTELQTYGDKAAKDIFYYFMMRSKNVCGA